MTATITELKHWIELKERLAPESRSLRTPSPYSVLSHVPRVECIDGFSMSVQASISHYCTPRDNCGPWSNVEVGYPSAEEPMLLSYAEDEEEPTDTVYGYVPFDIVADVIQKHGGLRPRIDQSRLFGDPA